MVGAWHGNEPLPGWEETAGERPSLPQPLYGQKQIWRKQSHPTALLNGSVFLSYGLAKSFLLSWKGPGHSGTRDPCSSQSTGLVCVSAVTPNEPRG